MRPASILFLALAGLVAVTAVFVGPRTLEPSLVVEQSSAVAEQGNAGVRLSVVQFIYRNRGYTRAQSVRLRTLTAEINQPETLVMVDDFQLAHPLEQNLAVGRRIIFRRPAPPRVEGEVQTPVRRPTMGLVVVADYANKNLLLWGNLQKRWYYTYRLGDQAAWQASATMRERFEPYVGAVLNPPEAPTEPVEPDPSADQG